MSKSATTLDTLPPVPFIHKNFNSTPPIWSSCGRQFLAESCHCICSKRILPFRSIFFLGYELIVPLFFIMWKLYFFRAIHNSKPFDHSYLAYIKQNSCNKRDLDGLDTCSRGFFEIKVKNDLSSWDIFHLTCSKILLHEFMLDSFLMLYIKA